MDGKFVVRGNGDALSAEAMGLQANHRRAHRGLAPVAPEEAADSHAHMDWLLGKHARPRPAKMEDINEEAH